MEPALPGIQYIKDGREHCTMKRIVGIVPFAKLFETDDYYKDNYIFSNSYVLRVAESGGVPMGILGVDGYAVEEALDRCDAILICGGRKIFPYHFQAARHAVRHGKPLLGICLGMQVIHSYFAVEDEARRRGYAGDLLALYETMKRERHMFTLPVDHHWDVPLVRGRVAEAKHPVRIVPGTRLSAILGADTVSAVTLHRYQVNDPSERLTISAYAEDDVIEGLEYGTKVLGVQFHPEVEGELSALFRFLVEA